MEGISSDKSLLFPYCRDISNMDVLSTWKLLVIMGFQYLKYEKDLSQGGELAYLQERK